MNVNQILHSLYIAGIGLGLTACQDGEESYPQETAGGMPVEFDLEMTSRALNALEEDDNRATLGLDPLDYYFNPGQSVLLISQKTQESQPFSSANPTPTYKYTYYVNDEADWDYGYNFEPFDGVALDWKNIEKYPYDTDYAFGALYFPVDNEMVTSVNTNQSDFNNYLKSDILGAYHTTGELYSRLRFRLFHLMTGINIKLWVPDWSEENNTGFFDNALTEASLLDMETNFNLIWPEKSSEEPPTASTENLSESRRRDISMLIPDKDNSHDVNDRNLENFNLDSDKVREYSLVALFPAQTITDNDNLIRFTLTRNGIRFNYTFSPRKITSGSFAMKQGTMTNLTLYLPRFENEALLVNAQIVDWMEGDTEFDATPL